MQESVADVGEASFAVGLRKAQRGVRVRTALGLNECANYLHRRVATLLYLVILE